MSHEEENQQNQELSEKENQENLDTPAIEDEASTKEPDQPREQMEAQVSAPLIRVMTGIVSDTGEDEASTDASDESASVDPFDSALDDVLDAEEVVARDERTSTAPVDLRSSVQLAMEQHPPRRAKLNDGPRSRMLADLIPEVIIPTNSLETRGFSKINVTEGQAPLAPEASTDADSSVSGISQKGKGQEPSNQDVLSNGEMSLEDLINVIDGKESPEPNPSSDQSATGVMDAVKRPSVSKRKRGFKKPTLSPFKIAMIIIVAILAIVLALAGLFTWDRWYRYDDAQDMLGEWKMTNAERTMVFTEAVMKIDDEVSYRYVIDPKEKTITYTFGGSEGTASYRFSADRQTLIIDETGEDVDLLVTLHLKSDPVMEDRDVPDGITKLQKISDNTDASPQNTEEVASEDDSYVEGVYIPGYNEFKRPTIGDSDDTKNKSAEGADADDDSDEDSDDNDDGAVYVDDETGTRYYYDSSQVLYYDQYGNYYYDMYGNNPYEVYTESGYDDTDLWY